MCKRMLALLVVSLFLTGAASAWDLTAEFEADYDAPVNPGPVWSEGIYTDYVGGAFQLYDKQFQDGWHPYKGWVMTGVPDIDWSMAVVGQHNSGDYTDNPTWWPDRGMSYRPWQCFAITPDEVAHPTAGNGFRFTAPGDGEYPVAIEFENRSSALGENPDQLPTGVFVTLNDAEVHNDIVIGFTYDTAPLPQNVSNYGATLTLMAGDTITFGAYNLDGQLGSHLVGIDAVITPEPATMSLLGLGMLALLRRRR